MTSPRTSRVLKRTLGAALGFQLLVGHSGFRDAEATAVDRGGEASSRLAPLFEEAAAGASGKAPVVITGEEAAGAAPKDTASGPWVMPAWFVGAVLALTVPAAFLGGVLVGQGRRHRRRGAFLSAGRAQYWLEGPVELVGRDQECGIRIADPRVSRVHARLWRWGSAWVIEDLRSEQGTFVNNARLAGAQRLEDGDVIAFAGWVAVFGAGNTGAGRTGRPGT